MAVGRPSDFTEEVKEKLLFAIEKGATYCLSCNYAGISYQTFKNWRNKAEDDNIPEFVSFFAKLKEVEAKTALRWLAKIEKASDEGEWTAAAWKLERRFYKDYNNNLLQRENDERLEKLEDESRTKE